MIANGGRLFDDLHGLFKVIGIDIEFSAVTAGKEHLQIGIFF